MGMLNPKLMFTKLCLIIVLALSVSCGPSVSPLTEPVDPPSTEQVATPSEQVVDIEAIMAVLDDQQKSEELASQNTDTYAWDMFIFLNWPALMDKPWLPDSAKSIGSAGPVVWQGWKQNSAIYLPNGAEPPPWDTPSPVPVEVLKKAQEMGLPAGPFQNIDLIQQADGLVFKAAFDGQGNTIRYNIAMNESTFNYIRQNGLYSINGQEAIAQGTGPIDTISFDWSAMEIKTSWIWLEGNPDQAAIEEVYFTANTYYQKLKNDGTLDGYEVGRAALSGMHMISKARPQWVWITFENIHNAEYTRATIELGIPPQAQAANKIYQQALAGTIYEQYQLVGTQISFEQDGKATLLANSQIESAFQTESSCITCHDLATISEKPDGPFRFSFVDTTGGNLSYYTGLPPETPGFLPMDYVWSLRLAHRQPNSQ